MTLQGSTGAPPAESRSPGKSVQAKTTARQRRRHKTGSVKHAEAAADSHSPSLADRMQKVFDAGFFMAEVSGAGLERLRRIQGAWGDIERRHAESAVEYAASAQMICEAFRDRLQELSRLSRNPLDKQFELAEALAKRPITVHSFRAAGTERQRCDWTRPADDWALLLNILLRRAEFKAFYAGSESLRGPLVTGLVSAEVIR